MVRLEPQFWLDQIWIIFSNMGITNSLLHKLCIHDTCLLRCATSIPPLGVSLKASNISSRRCSNQELKKSVIVHFRMQDGSYVFYLLLWRSWRRSIICPSFTLATTFEKWREGWAGMDPLPLKKTTPLSWLMLVRECTLVYCWTD
jgi:hypothetical protein